MAAPVQAERFLLVVELLDLRPGRHVRQRHARRGRARPSSPPPNRSACPGPCRAACGCRARRRRRWPRTAARARLRSARDVGSPPATSESQAPDFTSASNTRLLARRRSRISQSACSDGMRPPSCGARREDRVDRALAQPLDRRQPEADAACRGSTEKCSWLSLMSGGSTGMPRSRHSARYIASLSVFCASMVSSAAAKCHG